MMNERVVQGGGGGGAHTFLRHYAAEFRRLVEESEPWVERLVEVKDLLIRVSARGNTVMVVGNGGSAAIASHVAVDLTKNAGVRSVNFNEPDLITCLANDYGYAQWMAHAIALYGRSGDVLIAISSSGRSKNVLNACHAARRKRFEAVLTFSGFSPDNPLRQLGDQNFWVGSCAYNLVETVHQFWLLALVDVIIGRTDYPARPTGSRAARPSTGAQRVRVPSLV